MSKHRGFIFMLMLVPMAITGLVYASVVTVEHTMYQHKVDSLLKAASVCNPAMPASDDFAFPQEAPQDAPPPCTDGPQSVFHPLENFDDLVNRNQPDPDLKATDINVRH